MGLRGQLVSVFLLVVSTLYIYLCLLASMQQYPSWQSASWNHHHGSSKQFFQLDWSSDHVAKRRLNHSNGTIANNHTSTTGWSEPVFDTEKGGPVVDVIVIGSRTRPHYMDGQEMTFGSHPSVRRFVRFSEVNDTEKDCSTRLTLERIKAYLGRCTSKKWTGNKLMELLQSKLYTLRMIRRRYSYSNPAGWLCAQKRPIDALYHVLSQYRTNSHGYDRFPDYLILADDDTWLNMPAVLDELLQTFPPSAAHAVAGCRLRFTAPIEESIAIGWGGYSNIFTRRVLERFTTPVHCSPDDKHSDTSYIMEEDDFNTQVCARLRENKMGERDLFENGMTLLDLMYKFTFDQPFLDVSEESEKVGFCFHSDWAPSIFVNLYFLANRVPHPEIPHHKTERIAPYRESDRYNALFAGECKNEGNERCTPESHICHKVSPEHMVSLHLAQKHATTG